MNTNFNIRSFKIRSIIVPVAAALLISAGTAFAAEPVQPAFEEDAPATLSFGTDPNDNGAPEVAATAEFVDTNTKAPVNTRVAAGFQQGNDNATSDVTVQTRVAAKNADGPVIAGTR